MVAKDERSDNQLCAMLSHLPTEQKETKETRVVAPQNGGSHTLGQTLCGPHWSLHHKQKGQTKIDLSLCHHD